MSTIGRTRSYISLKTTPSSTQNVQTKVALKYGVNNNEETKQKQQQTMENIELVGPAAKEMTKHCISMS